MCRNVYMYYCERNCRGCMRCCFLRTMNSVAQQLAICRAKFTHNLFRIQLTLKNIQDKYYNKYYNKLR